MQSSQVDGACNFGDSIKTYICIPIKSGFRQDIYFYFFEVNGFATSNEASVLRSYSAYN
jgi:hypothetical protein